VFNAKCQELNVSCSKTCEDHKFKRDDDENKAMMELFARGFAAAFKRFVGKIEGIMVLKLMTAKNLVMAFGTGHIQHRRRNAELTTTAIAAFVTNHIETART
jgi:hypothetical protein